MCGNQGKRMAVQRPWGKKEEAEQREEGRVGAKAVKSVCV